MLKLNSLFKRDFIKNYCFAFVAVVLQIGSLQLLILPLVSKTMDTNEYGLMLTLVSIVDIVAITLGSTICNVRLINKSQYEDSSFNGDYKVCCILYCIIAVLITMVLSVIYEKSFSLSTILIGLMAVFAFLFSYSQVSIRLNKKFQYDTVTSLLISLGFFVGYLVYRITGLWQLIYIFGYGIGYIFCGTVIGKFYKEPLSMTPSFLKTNRKIIDLSGAGFIKQLITYADRLILYPLLGGEFVATYYAASLVGKCVTLASHPLNSLLLSYISKPEGNTKKYMFKVIAYSTALCFVLYWICLLISKPMILFLYPQYCNSAMSIIKITMFSAMLDAAISIITPFTLKFFKTSMQVTVSVISTVIYFVFAMILLPYYKLWGFSLAVLLSGVAKYIIIVFLGLSNDKRNLAM